MRLTIDHGHALGADGHREHAVAGDDRLDRDVVLHEVRGAQDGGGQIQLLDHAFHGVLAREVRHVGVLVGIDHRQVDDALDARLARHVERLQRLRDFVRRERIEQEQRANAGHGGAHRLDAGQVADDAFDAGGQRRLAELANHGAHLGALLGQALDDEGTDGSGGTDDEDAHLKLRGVEVVAGLAAMNERYGVPSYKHRR